MSYRIRRFRARFDSDCPGCGWDIYEGDDVGYVDGEVQCDNCCDDAEEND